MKSSSIFSSFPLPSIISIFLVGLTGLDSKADQTQTEQAFTNITFSLKLSRELIGDRSTNVMISPYSVDQALGLAAAGASGDTQKEFKKILSDLLPVRVSSDIEWNNVNRLWGSSQFKFAIPYLNSIQQKFKADAVTLNFKTDLEASRSKINNWVLENTKQKIKDLIPAGALKDSSVSVLTNAVYFKAPWSDRFQVDATKPAPFKLANGKFVSAKFMSNTKWYSHGENKLMKWVSIPYGVARASSFIVLLPKESQTPKSILGKIDSRLLAEILDSPSKMLQLELPKFRFEFHSSLENHLQNMGLKKAFVAGLADFTKMLDPMPIEPVYISQVIHKTFIEIDEKGTEAAAATAVMMEVGSAAIDSPEIFKADRPFLFLIVNGAAAPRQILFIGQLADPNLK